MIDNNFKNAFEDIQVSEQLEQKIFNQTLYKKKKRNSYKFAYALIACFIFSVITLNGVRADIEPEPFDLSYTRMILDDGNEVVLADHLIQKTLPDDVAKTFSDQYFYYTHEEVEQTLGFDLLMVKDAHPVVEYHTVYNKVHTAEDSGDNENNDIAVVHLYSKGILSNISEEHNLQLKTTILTNKANEAYQYCFIADMDINGRKVLQEAYHSSHLNVDVAIYSNEDLGDDYHRLTAVFAYDDVLYQLVSDGLEKEELIEIVENME